MKVVGHGFELVRHCLCSTVLLALVYPLSSAAIPIVVDGTSYDVSVQVTSYSVDASTLMNNPWWGDSNLAGKFAVAVGDKLGRQTGVLLDYNAVFAFATETRPGASSVSSVAGRYLILEDKTGARTRTNTLGSDFFLAGSDYRYAIAAKSTVVPEPATMTLMGLGLLGLSFARKRQP